MPTKYWNVFLKIQPIKYQEILPYTMAIIQTKFQTKNKIENKSNYVLNVNSAFIENSPHLICHLMLINTDKLCNNTILPLIITTHFRQYSLHSEGYNNRHIWNIITIVTISINHHNHQLNALRKDETTHTRPVNLIASIVQRNNDTNTCLNHTSVINYKAGHTLPLSSLKHSKAVKRQDNK